MSTNKQPSPARESSNVPVASRVTNTIQPGAPGVSLEETVESGVEKMVKEYGPPVVTAVLVVILAAAGWAFFVSRQESVSSNRWDQLNVSATAKNVANLEGIAAEARGSLVGAVATNVAGITELNSALEKMVREPEKAKTEIKAAIDRFKQVIDSPDATEMIKQQAKYAMAFAHESVGEFDEARGLYQELAAIKDSPTERFAKDGLQRCNDPIIKSFQEKFAAWKPPGSGIAPADFNGLNIENLDLQGIGDSLAPPSLPDAQPTGTDVPKTDPSGTTAPPADPPVTDVPASDSTTLTPPVTDSPVNPPANNDEPPKLPGGGE
ncbi:MAG: hypothetical protein JNL67_16835 [Planctomycetaceae bacterium]|nr:hypothetical protein [Planctomycetaceae bacterium]